MLIFGRRCSTPLKAIIYTHWHNCSINSWKTAQQIIIILETLVVNKENIIIKSLQVEIIIFTKILFENIIWISALEISSMFFYNQFLIHWDVLIAEFMTGQSKVNSYFLLKEEEMFTL